MSYGLEVLDRIDVGGDPVNWIDPWGLLGEAVIPINPGPGGYSPGPSIPHGGTGSGHGGTGSISGGGVGSAITGLGIAGGLGWILNEGDNNAHDKYLGKQAEKKLKKKLAEECETIEDLKTGGKGAGGYDLYVKPNGDIVTKPKGGKGPGEPTGWNTSEL